MKARLEPPVICLITKGDLTQTNFSQKRTELSDIVRAACESGVGMVQIREKALPARLLLELTRDAVEIAADYTTSIVVNDRADVAAAAGADGVHLRSDSIPVEVVRTSFPNLMIGVSAHSLETAKAARDDGADHVTLAPIFETPGKGRPLGLDELARVARELAGFPVIALGGIEERNYADTIWAGASGFAAIRFLNNTENLKALSKNLLQAHKIKK